MGKLPPDEERRCNSAAPVPCSEYDGRAPGIAHIREPATLSTSVPEVPATHPRTIEPRFDALIARRKRRMEPAPLDLALDLSVSKIAAKPSSAGDEQNEQRISADIARSAEQMSAAHGLVRRRYAWRGYSLDDPSDARLPDIRPSREITVIASDDHATVGTLTLGLDGPRGLRADETHGDSVANARLEGRRVCELTRLAVDERADSRAVLASLFTLVYEVGRTIHGVTDVFVEVNPRHVAFYTRVLGFVVAAGERFCERVRAPSVLLHLEVGQLEERLRALCLGMRDPSMAFATAA